MAKLSEVIKLRDDMLSIIDHLSMEQAISEKITYLDVVVSSCNIDPWYGKLLGLTNRYKEIINDTNSVIDNAKTLLAEIQLEIDTQADYLIQLQQQKSIGLTEFHYISERKIDLPDVIKNTVNVCSQWKFPGLQLYPEHKSWIDTMVTCDPLYLVDSDLLSVKDKIQDYTEQYQRRLCIYKDLDRLPLNQFGMILAYNFLNFMPFTEVEFYLNKFFNLLRPGGNLIFTYNNCDLYPLAKMAEDHSMFYADTKLITKVCSELGYSIIRTESTPTTWMQITKPGELSTTKISQVLGKPLPK